MSMKDCRKRYYNKCKADGKCVQCSLPRGEHCTQVLCRKCADTLIDNGIKLAAKRKLEMVCLKCAGPLFHTTSYCDRHWFEMIAQSNTGTNKHWNALRQKLIDQDYKCAYSGRPLIPGVNASVDHVKPRSVHPELKTALNNLVWSDSRVNDMKDNMDLSEFIALCGVVHARMAV